MQTRTEWDYSASIPQVCLTLRDDIIEMFDECELDDSTIEFYINDYRTRCNDILVEDLKRYSDIMNEMNETKVDFETFSKNCAKSLHFVRIFTGLKNICGTIYKFHGFVHVFHELSLMYEKKGDQAEFIINSLIASMNKVDDRIQQATALVSDFIRKITDEKTGKIKPELLKKTKGPQKARFEESFGELHKDFAE